jgi:hypothetical protein
MAIPGYLEDSQEDEAPRDCYVKIEVITCANRKYDCYRCTRRGSCQYAEGL